VTSGGTGGDGTGAVTGSSGLNASGGVSGSPTGSSGNSTGASGGSSGANGNGSGGESGDGGGDGIAGSGGGLTTGGGSGIAPGQSCNGMTGTECQGEDCCASPLVPGGTFERTLTNTFTATVSSFRLDEFEVTVARYRNFMNARDEWRAAGNPIAGAGENPNIPGTGWDKSWEDAWQTAEDPTFCASDGGRATYAETGNDALPANCVTWTQAFEFCVWDGGRLPSATEWEFAAVGGSLQYQYPWGNAPVPTGQQDETADYAVYDSLGDGSGAGDATFADILPVGSKPLGVGPFGQMDLAGSVFEWTLDRFSIADDPEAMAEVTDWANYDPTWRMVTIRGGCWSSGPEDLNVTQQLSTLRETYLEQYGFRCARDP
jgi:formylglycine-generating enzyme required for sulfatase activity